MSEKTTFALFFGNRGFFPPEVIADAQQEIKGRLDELGHDYISMDESLTQYGAVQTREEGQMYANFLREHAGEYGGVILSLPNFGDENGALAAFKNCDVPIYIQAYPDEMDKMAPALRRDAFCGKFSIMDVFYQAGITFTALQPHTVSPSSDRFAANIDHFDRVCRVYNGLNDITVGAIGARTTDFKTVRIDELALQRNGILMETLDLSMIFARMNELDDQAQEVQAKEQHLAEYTNWDQVPSEAFETLVKLGVSIDQFVEEYEMDAVAIRCWIEMQEQLGISPCVLISEMNDRGIVTACEVDIGNALAMLGLSLASGNVATVLDWNNNYKDVDDKCILFHCGPVPKSMMLSPGQVTDHSILQNSVGEGNAYGPVQGRIQPLPFTFSSIMTEEGRIRAYIGEGRFTDDEIPDDFFGCAGVAEIENLQDVLQTVGYQGHRHHVSVTPDHVMAPVFEAFARYLDYDVTPV